MPFPIPALVLGAPFVADAGLCVLTGIAAVGASIDAYYRFYTTPQEVLPKFKDTAKAMTDDINADARYLLEKLDNQVSHDEKQSHEEHERMSEALILMESGLTALEGHNAVLDEVEASYATQESFGHETLQSVKANAQQQQLDIESIKASLESLPKLLKSHRDQRALIDENQQLKSEVTKLKRQVSELSSSLDEALSLTENTLADNDALRHQQRLAHERNQGTIAHLGFGLFR